MLYFIRHGETEKNHANLMQGRSDIPLNETGLRQAKELGQWLRQKGIRFDAVYSSPLGRAIETARLTAGEEVPIILDQRLIEMDYGPYEGMDLLHPAPEVLAFFRDFAGTPAPEGMEQLDAVVARLASFLEEHRREAAEKTLLVSTHAISMKGALEYLTPGSNGAYWSRHLANCALYRTELTETGYSVPVQIIPD